MSDTACAEDWMALGDTRHEAVGWTRDGDEVAIYTRCGHVLPLGEPAEQVETCGRCAP